MLTVPVPVAGLHERDLPEKQFVEKRLVFIERLKGLFKSSHRLYCFPTDQYAAGRRGLAFIPQETRDHFRRIDQPSRCYAEAAWFILRGILRFSSPAEPPHGGVVDDCGLAVPVEDLDLSRQLLRVPDVVAIEQRNVFPATGTDAEIT